MRKSANRLADEPELIDEQPQLLDRASQMLRTLNQETAAHPFRTVGLAAGAGFVLGGGLLTPLTARALGAAVRVGLRLAVFPAFTRALALVGARLLEDSKGYRSTVHAEEERP